MTNEEKSEKCCEDDEEKFIPEKRRMRQQLEISDYSKTCFFCSKFEEKEENLHQCQTFRLNEKIRTIAKELEDHHLLARLSGGDMIATEARYHLKCLTELYNRHRAMQSNSTEDDNQKFIEGNTYQNCVVYLLLTSYFT